ncbi:hypothetical protein PIB30_095496 [Stylosanthes scabra]|uniref:Aminotransferase-like plant mobile domain-containing protein n=1 Tax=Stylosanthes scabra TaxID=79078 RepID=A0ABU6WYH6_9FABA|nr:hypothetical protein [Stylosanthes scabra]
MLHPVDDQVLALPDKSDNMVSVRWVPLLKCFDAWAQLSWGSAVLSYTYHHLCQAVDRDTTDIASCTPLIMSWIYQRLNGYQQLNRDNHERWMMQIRAKLDRLGVHEIACTPYDAPAWDALRPVWVLTQEEQRTWLAVVPIVCFMYVRMHHVDRLKRQLGGEQQISEDPVNLDGFLAVSARGEDQHWPTRHRQWYDDWRARFTDERQITITPTQYPAMPTQQYFDWW